MPSNCCQKAAIFSEENRNSLQDLIFLSLDESMLSKHGENLPNCGSGFGVHYAAATRGRNGSCTLADHLLASDCDVRATQNTELPATRTEHCPYRHRSDECGHALNRRHEAPSARGIRSEIERLPRPGAGGAGRHDVASADCRGGWRRHPGTFFHRGRNQRLESLDRLVVIKLLLGLPDISRLFLIPNQSALQCQELFLPDRFKLHVRCDRRPRLSYILAAAPRRLPAPWFRTAPR